MGGNIYFPCGNQRYDLCKWRLDLLDYFWCDATDDSLFHSFSLQAKQLKDYENAVIAKRLEELDDDEIQALVEEIDREDF